MNTAGAYRVPAQPDGPRSDIDQQTLFTFEANIAVAQLGGLGRDEHVYLVGADLTYDTQLHGGFVQRTGHKELGLSSLSPGAGRGKSQEVEGLDRETIPLPVFQKPLSVPYTLERVVLFPADPFLPVDALEVLWRLKGNLERLLDAVFFAGGALEDNFPFRVNAELKARQRVTGAALQGRAMTVVRLVFALHCSHRLMACLDETRRLGIPTHSRFAQLGNDLASFGSTSNNSLLDDPSVYDDSYEHRTRPGWQPGTPGTLGLRGET
ncbi:hypothetical protein C8F04DRAFT_1266378 [Mycena alexandri]|uniref:Uncharacterized protein n=1 Tax=Mycena alexandri TaxID=1745969 RepID=A0AAD6SJG9_9AGAR|nr:hypothetical protein C8F04DRAFT_1266378 [Mycena alexandri]